MVLESIEANLIGEADFIEKPGNTLSIYAGDEKATKQSPSMGYLFCNSRFCAIVLSQTIINNKCYE